MRPFILYRESLIEEPEASCMTVFACSASRMDIKAGDLVVGRYSVLPYYKEQEHDNKAAGAALINTYQQHQWIADVGAWACEGGTLERYTPQTWMRLEDIPEEGPFVLKGQTNSRKHQWNTHMYAANKQEAVQVYTRLLDDSLIGQQQIYIRKYIPFKRLMTGFNGLPITMEFRFFIAYGKVLTGGFYWSSHVGDLEWVPSPKIVPEEFLEGMAAKVSRHANFVALDVAMDERGHWWVVEVNDGQMAGLSENDPDLLYRRLHEVILERYRQ
jgi:hypothetical protein